MYSNELTMVIPGWSKRSYQLLKTFIFGLKSEPDPIPGVKLGELNSSFKITKVIYRFEGQRNLNTSGMWLFGRNDADHALFFASALHPGYGGTGAAFGEMLLEELGVITQMISAVYERINGHKPHEVIFELNNDGIWHISHKLLVFA